jgi:type VI secretion system secreted protein Hcp
MAFDAYIKFEGGPQVEGESERDGHEGEIAILSYSFGASNNANIGGNTKGSAAGTGDVHPFSFTKETDLGSPTLFQACLQGSHFPKAKVTLNKSGGQESLPYLTYEFEEVYISNFSWSGSTSDAEAPPMETLTLEFGKVKINYSQQTEKGSAGKQMAGSWNVRKQTP